MSELRRVIALAELLKKQRQELTELEEAAAEKKKALLKTEREDLPDLMAEVGLTEIKLDDGTIVTIKEEVDAKISEANRTSAMSWLTDNGFGGIIKTEVSVTFGSGEHDNAIELVNELNGNGYESAQMAETVHPSTLKAFVKERLAEGTAIPFDVFGIFPYNKAIIKEKK